MNSLKKINPNVNKLYIPKASNANQINAEHSTVTNVESFNTQSNAEFDWGGDAEWNTVTEVSNGVNKLNLNLHSDFNQHLENASLRKEEQPVAQAINDWGRPTIPGIKTENVENTPDNIILKTEPVSYI